MDTAAARPTPIPVYAEMSSVNPVVLLEGALASRGEAIATNPLVLQLEIIKKWNGISPSVVVLGKGLGTRISGNFFNSRRDESR